MLLCLHCKQVVAAFAKLWFGLIKDESILETAVESE